MRPKAESFVLAEGALRLQQLAMVWDDKSQEQNFCPTEHCPIHESLGTEDPHCRKAEGAEIILVRMLLQEGNRRAIGFSWILMLL